MQRSQDQGLFVGPVASMVVVSWSEWLGGPLATGPTEGSDGESQDQSCTFKQRHIPKTEEDHESEA
ncbi:MAG: hypothetical protein O6768_06615, partial [Planctomycetota bacterium]|nr:hypothetical protein [Planctomycetota bacterium]